MKTNLHWSLVICLLALVVSSTSAGPNQNGMPLNPAQQATIDILKELHLTRALLEHSDHDYQGRRHQSIKDLGQAIKQLQVSLPKHHQHHVNNLQKMHAHKSGGNLTQAQSDAQLQQARGQMKTIEAQLSKFDGPHHQKALVDVARAIEQVDRALQIK